MRPYLAIIKDSFRAALASRVLYVLLAIIVIVLAALSPLHVREALDTRIEVEEVDQPAIIARRLMERKDDGSHPGAQRIWEMLPDGVKEKVQTAFAEDDKIDAAVENEGEEEQDGRKQRRSSQNRSRGGFFDLVSALNDLIQDRDFFQAEDWEDRMDAESNGLVDAGVDNLTDEQSARLNRILIGRALSIGTGSQSAVGLYYANWRANTFSQTQQQFASMVTSFLPWVFDKIVLSIGLLIAILVTANIIPETFEPGSLNLLLSKPLNRSGLFLAKFFGGCIFVTLCSTLLFCGLWMWLGFGMKIWDRSILISIPLYILVFAIYYSVSAFVGLVSRSVILSIIATAVFWAACFAVGTTYMFFNNRMENAEIIEVAATPEGVLQSNSFYMVSSWKDDESSWDMATDADLNEEDQVAMGMILYMAELPPLPARLGPIHDPVSGKLVAGRILLTDNGTLNRQDLMIGEPGEEFKKVGRFKSDTVGMFATAAGPVVVTRNGDFFRLDVKAGEASKPSGEKTESADEGSVEDDETNNENLAEKEPARKAELFIPLGPDSPAFVDAGAVDYNYSTNEIGIYSRGDVSIYALGDDGQYVFKRSIEVETGTTKKSMSCRLAYQGNTVLLALGNGQIITLDGKTLAEKNGYLPESKFATTEVRGSHDGRFFAVCYRHERLWLLDTENEEEMYKADIRGQGSISAINFSADNQMIVGDRTDRVTVYNLPDFTVDESFSPSGNWIDKSFRYGLRPLYKVFPKPGEFYKVVGHLSDTSDTSRNPDVDLKRQEVSTDPWSPLVSGVGFMVVMLALSCFVFWRKDY